MKAISFITQNFKNIMIGVLIVFLIIALMKCQGEKNKNQEGVAAMKALEAKADKSEALRLEERKQYDVREKEAAGRRQLAEVEKTEADKVVKQQQGKIDQLTAIIRSGAATTPQDTGVLVSAAYKDACDSLPAEIDKLNLALADKDTALNGMLDLYGYEVKIRDEEIEKERKYSDSLKVDFKKQTANLKASLKLVEPKGRFMAGISILGNQTNILSGAGVVLAYQTRGGKQYQVSPKFIKTPGQSSAEVYYEGTVLFTILK